MEMKQLNEFIKFICIAIRFFKWKLVGFIYTLASLLLERNSVVVFKSELSEQYGNLQSIISYWNDHKELHFNLIVANSNVNPLAAIKLIAKAKIIVLDQSNRYVSNLNLQNKMIVIQCWHGGGLLKKIAYDSHSNRSGREQKRIARVYRNINYIVISDKRYRQIFSEAFRLPIDSILPFGLPRIDNLMKQNVKTNRNLLCKLINIQVNSLVKFVLYAPTYRESAVGRTTPLPIQPPNFLSNYVFLFRAHPSVRTYTLPKGWIDASHVSQEILLSASDILLSDFSSIIFDFSIFKRPIGLIATDYTDYSTKERGLYVALSELTLPNQIFSSWSDLFNFLRLNTFECYDIWSQCMSSCDGKSTSRLMHFIESLFNK